MDVERQGNLSSDETALYIVVAIQLTVFVKTHRTVLYKRGAHYGNRTLKKKKELVPPEAVSDLGGVS